jgi:hypothetical protein
VLCARWAQAPAAAAVIKKAVSKLGAKTGEALAAGAVDFRAPIVESKATAIVAAVKQLFKDGH